MFGKTSRNPFGGRANVDLNLCNDFYFLFFDAFASLNLTSIAFYLIDFNLHIEYVCSIAH